MAPSKNRVSLPSEPTDIGQWKENEMSLSTIYDSNKNCLLSQDLFEASFKFYSNLSLKLLSELKTTTYDEVTKLLVPKAKLGSPSKNRRFIVDVGHHKYHEDNYTNRPCMRLHNREVEQHDSFREAIENHYQWCFKSNEIPFIAKALDRENIIHVVIYNRFYKTINRVGKEVEPIYKLVAAATFVIADSSSTLLYIGVNGDDFFKSDYYQFVGTTKQKPIQYKNQSLGTFMLCMVQKIVYCVTNSHAVIAQVKNHKDEGAIYYYLQRYFKIIHQAHHLIYENKLKFGNDIYQEVHGLVYMISRGPIYLITPYFMKTVSNHEFIEDAISLGVKYLLDLPDFKNDIFEKESYPLYTHCNAELCNTENKSVIVPIDDSETQSLTNYIVTKEDDSDKVIHVNTVFWERVLEKQQLEIINVSSESKPQRKQYLYKVMALILFDDENRHADLRCFFYYIFQCIGFMSPITNCPLFDYDKRSQKHKDNDPIYNFQCSVIKAVELCEHLFGVDEIKKFNLLESTAAKHSGAENIQNAISYLSNKQFNLLYPGSHLELLLFGEIFNIDFSIYFGYSLHFKGVQNNIRKWIIKKQDENSSLNNLFHLSKKKITKANIPLLFIDDTRYLIVGNKSIMSLLEYNETKINLMCSTWINTFQEKQFNPNSEDLSVGPYAISNINFNYNELIHYSIKVKYRFIITMILDPKLSWVIKNLSLVPKLKLKIYDFLSLRPTTYTSSSILNAYIDHIKTLKPDSNCCLISSDILEAYVINDRVRNNFKDNVSKYKHYSTILNVDSNHWVCVEFKFDGNKQDKITIFVADSNYQVNADRYVKYENLRQCKSFFLFINDLCIKQNDNYNLDYEHKLAMDGSPDIYDAWKNAVNLKFGSHIEEQTNGFDCGICCLRRMRHMYLSGHFSSQVPKQPKFIDQCTTRQFRLLILQSLLPVDLKQDLHPTLIAEIVKSKSKDIKTSVQHETGLTSSEDEVDEINLLADEIKSSQDIPFDEDMDDSVQILNPPVADINDLEIEETLSNPPVDIIENDPSAIGNPEIESMVSIPPVLHQYVRKVRKQGATTDSSTSSISDNQEMSETGDADVSDDESGSTQSDDKSSTHSARSGEEALATEQEEIPNADEEIIDDESIHDRIGPKLSDLITRYDENQPNPNKREIDSVSDQLVTRLVKKHKKRLNPSQKKDWEQYAFDESQQSDLAAYNAIKNALANETRKLEGELEEITIRFERKNNILINTPPGEVANTLRKELKSISNEWVFCKTQLLLNNYRSKCSHYFHPFNNIKAVKKDIKKDINNKNTIEETYYAYVINEQGKEITKRVDPQFIRDKLSKDYLNYFDKHQEQKGWLCFDKDDILETQSPDDEFKKKQKTLAKSYRYNTNGDGDTILYLRVNFVMESEGPRTNKTFLYKSDSLTFHYKTCRSRYYKRFSNRNEVDDLDPIPLGEQQNINFLDIIGRSDMDIDDLKIPLSDKLLFKALKNSINEHKAQRISNKRLIDRYDPEFKNEDQGILGKIQMNYVNTRCRNFKMQEHYQISRIRFNVKKNEWEGVQFENDQTLSVVKLNEKWVISNFPKYHKFFKAKSIEGSNKFLQVPIGDVIDVHPTMDISNNPSVKYLQGQNDICVFASLASILHFNGMILEAEIVFNMRNDNIFKKNACKIIQTLLQIIQQDKRFKTFRRYYRNIKLDKNHDIFSHSILDGEFKLIVIKSDDNQMSHAVCLSNKFIFDSNVSKCLPMTREGINCCCGKNHNYIGILFGYYFQFQPKK